MEFTAWIESLKSLTQVLAGFGLVTVLLAWIKHIVERRRWQKFKRLTKKAIDRLIESERYPQSLSETEWKIECEQLLTDANFGPLEIETLLETAVIVAKGVSAEKVFM